VVDPVLCALLATPRNTRIPEGEYYSHFRVLTLNSEDPAADESDVENQANVAAITIEARTGVAIPIVWRNSGATPDASIEAVQVDSAANQISVDVRRHGPLSVRGYLHVLEKAADGSRNPLAEPVPLVIYPSLEARTMAIELNEGVIAANLSRGTEVYYSPDLEMTDQSSIIDSYPITP
jgi:hypothetical protein